METRAIWRDGMEFDGRAQDMSVRMDATEPLGHKYGFNPKELVLLGLAGCCGMDVVGLLKKNRQQFDRFEIEARVNSSTQHHPIVFNSIDLTFYLDGNIDEETALDAVTLSQNTYCGVSAMLVESMPINWSLFVNGKKIGEGKASFEKFDDLLHTSYEG